MHTKRRLWWIPLVALLLAIAGFVVWALSAAPPMPEALAAVESGDGVEVLVAPWLTFRPDGSGVATGNADVGLILYPGGRVDPRAYAPAARALARQGYLVVIVPMPLNLAVLGADRAGAVMQAYPLVDAWAVGGHSLGGSMAARYAYGHPDTVDGLVLWASYPADSDDLSGSALSVASIYAENDGLATPAEVDASRPLLPADTRWTLIPGGNHAQFGWYGPQRGDGRASISREAQQAEVVAATRTLLKALRDR
ncbi:MAG: alpha/beta fold hydrolase [Anaerolineae bacterium]